MADTQTQPGKLSGAQETLLVTLIARANDSQGPNPILNDKYAQPVLSKIASENDVDVAKFNVNNGATISISLRSRSLDKWATEFIRAHKESETDVTVLHLACGLDSRALRVQHKLEGLPEGNSRVRWIDLDLPDPVAMRETLGGVLPAPDESWEYKLVALSITSSDWLETIPADRPTLVIFEGLCMYLPEEVGGRMIKQLVEHFSSGQLIFDVVGKSALWMQSRLKPLQATGAKLVWAVDDVATIERLDSRLKLRDRVRHADFDGLSEVPQPTRFLYSMFWYIPWLRNIGSNLRFDF